MSPGRSVLFSAAVACALSVAGPSSADPTPSLALEPAPAGDRGFAVERAGVHGHLLPSARLVVDYAAQPLVLRNPAQEIDAVVAYQLWLHALASFSVAYRFQLNADVPFVAAQAGGQRPLFGGTAPDPGTGADFGDVRLGARVKVVGPAEDIGEGTELAVALSVWLPTATEGYAGDGTARVRGGFVLEGRSRRLYWAMDGGVRTRPAEELPGILPTRTGTAIALGLAGGFFADRHRHIAIGAEMLADLTLGRRVQLFDARATVAHAFITGHYRIAGGPFEVGGAFGPGIGQGAGSADYRALVLVGYAPERTAPPPDGDEDGIPDKADACVKLPGAPSPDPLLHGCPEAPPDRDGDAIPDRTDACPTVAGEPTGVRKTHGCPKPRDTDGDGVPDPDDGCPREPGVAPPEGNGCPKPVEPPSAAVVEQQIVISQQVQFETGTAVLRPESDAVLGEVARVLGEHPEIELVEVQGHTDDTGPADLNRRLGQQRAESVVAWLSRRGIARERLVPKGYGSDVPLADNATEEGRTKNRRVEFRIVRTKPPVPRESPTPKEESQPPKQGGGK